MIKRARQSLRSWMFIYAGLLAAIVLAGQPANGTDIKVDVIPAPTFDAVMPLNRQDI